jgi:hypothetical protein
MMNKFQDLMNDQIPVQIVVDAITDRAHHKVVKGIVRYVSRAYIEIGRLATGDEKSQLGTDEVRIVIPIEKVAEVIYGSNK